MNMDNDEIIPESPPKLIRQIGIYISSLKM